MERGGQTETEGRERERQRNQKLYYSSIYRSIHPDWQNFSLYPRIITLKSDMDTDNAPSNTIVLEFKEDTPITEVRFLL